MERKQRLFSRGREGAVDFDDLEVLRLDAPRVPKAARTRNRNCWQIIGLHSLQRHSAIPFYFINVNRV